MATFEELEQQYRDAVSRLQAAQQRLGAISDKTDPRRGSIKLELLKFEENIRDLKEQIKRENTRRNYAGVGSPLHEACAARFGPDVVAELEADAVARQIERESKAAERRAAKAPAASRAPTTPPPPIPTPAPKASSVTRKP